MKKNAGESDPSGKIPKSSELLGIRSAVLAQGGRKPCLSLRVGLDDPFFSFRFPPTTRPAALTFCASTESIRGGRAISYVSSRALAHSHVRSVAKSGVEPASEIIAQKITKINRPKCDHRSQGGALHVTRNWASWRLWEFAHRLSLRLNF